MLTKYEVKKLLEIITKEELTEVVENISLEELKKICNVMFEGATDWDLIAEAFELVLKSNNNKLLVEFLRRVGTGYGKEYKTIKLKCYDAKYLFFLALFDPNANIEEIIKLLEELNDPVWNAEFLKRVLRVIKILKHEQAPKKEEQEEGPTLE